MENKDKLSMLEEIMDLEPGELSEDMELKEIENWDSMAKISFIALMNKEFGKRVTNAQIADFKTVKDLIAAMERVN